MKKTLHQKLSLSNVVHSSLVVLENIRKKSRKLFNIAKSCKAHSDWEATTKNRKKRSCVKKKGNLGMTTREIESINLAAIIKKELFKHPQYLSNLKKNDGAYTKI